MNIVILSGNICKKEEMKSFENGGNAINGTVAVNKDFANPDGTYGTDFINIVLFNQTANYFKEYIEVGNKVEIIGKWQVRNYIDKDGNKRTMNECLVSNIKVVAKKKTDSDDLPVIANADDLPF